MKLQGQLTDAQLQPPDDKISGIHVFFLIHSVQTGVGGLGFQRIIAQKAGHDSWMAVLIAGVFVQIAIFFMYLALKKRREDLIALHQRILGSWLGKIFSLVFMIYFVSLGAAVTRSYSELVQIWMFPDLSTWSISLAMLLLVFYIVSGGFRVVVGISVLSVILPFYLLLLLIIPIEHAEFSNLLPIGEATFGQLLNASKEMMFSYLGFCTFLMYYPLIKGGPRTQKWAQSGALFTMILYFVVSIITLAYFSEKQLLTKIWATFSLFKVVQFPFLERFEYVGLASWAFVILDNVCLLLWASVRILRRLWPQSSGRKFLVATLVLIFLENIILSGRDDINKYIQFVNQWGVVINFMYLPLLYLVGFFREKWRRVP
ncbi:spore germination protein (amino acid permease) [Marininema mesophilum]|uniref:Spore germination protein (Amino acid permease) n=1 Tax=Marininema mesophilum TaxID=1048340 RepID=A0A1H3B4R5_9BACL|nr:GerAB/ArcD/ProY family transporter [Marininema mesophilum]SDX36785.1 spore germination protein (amino acid permease) [Marininema mesophilum]